MNNIGNDDLTAFIYEFYLKCDSIRLILTFNMSPKVPEFTGLAKEPIEADNKLILYPQKQLKNRDISN
jgi:hypothetical protein